jgi:RNA polymerase sigma-70 factor (ECF subfamily)
MSLLSERDWEREMWVDQSQSLPLDESRPNAETRRADTRLERLRRGDNDAWEELIADTQSRLYSYLLYNVPTSEDAQDLLSEIFMAALRSISTLDDSLALTKWLYAIARRKVADFWRQARPTSELSDSLEATSNNVSLEFREALAMLPEQTRQALLLRYREGLSVDEVARIMGRTYKATESLLSRGRSLLKAALDDMGGLDE